MTSLYAQLDPRLAPYTSTTYNDRVAGLKPAPSAMASVGVDAAPRSPGLTVVVLNLNRGELLIPLCQQMTEQAAHFASAGLGFELLIGDTGSSDADVLTFYERGLAAHAHVERGLRYHFSRNNNEVFARRGHFDAVLFLNNDVVLPAEGHTSLLTLYRHLMDAADVGVVGACMWYPDGLLQHAGIEFFRRNSVDGLCYHPGGRTPMAVTDLPAVLDVPAVTGACMMMRSAVFEEVGGFDPRYAEECQDVDLCLRARRLGWRCLLVNLGRVLHLENATRPKGSENWEDRRLFTRLWRSFVEAAD